MKTIKERSKRTRVVHPNWSQIECMRRGYIKGAKEEHKLLTRWHDPKEYPKDNREVLAKCNLAHYIIAIYNNEQETWVDAISGRPIQIIGWREI